MYNATAQDFANAQLWGQKAIAQLSSGPAIPAPPDGPLVGDQSTTLQPLPDNVRFDITNNGGVRFLSGIADPTKASQAYFWSGAKKSVHKGSLQYAQIAYNCSAGKMEEREDMNIEIGRALRPTAENPLTGLPGFEVTQDHVVPAHYVIPDEYDTVDKALEFINDPRRAFRDFGGQ